MASVISVAIFDLEGTKRPSYTRRTLESLLETVDFNKHVLYLGDNNSCQETKDYLNVFQNLFRLKFPEQHLKIEHHAENLGTAKCVNRGWAWAKHNFNGLIGFGKMDNDVIVHQAGWLDDIEEVINRYPKLAICGLKRFDLDEHPYHPNEWYRSHLRMVPHEKGKYDYVVEICHHVMGTVTIYSAEIINKIGGLWQDGIYALDDSYACVRAQTAGFETGFLHGIKISHIDEGGNDYTQWKADYAGEKLKNFNRICEEYRSGKRHIYEQL